MIYEQCATQLRSCFCVTGNLFDREYVWSFVLQPLFLPRYQLKCAHHPRPSHLCCRPLISANPILSQSAQSLIGQPLSLRRDAPAKYGQYRDTAKDDRRIVEIAGSDWEFEWTEQHRCEIGVPERADDGHGPRETAQRPAGSRERARCQEGTPDYACQSLIKTDYRSIGLAHSRSEHKRRHSEPQKLTRAT